MVRRLLAALPMTVAAAEQALRHVVGCAHDDQLVRLLSTAAVVEMDHACLGPAAIQAQTLRELIAAAAAATGRSWKIAHRDDEPVAAFSALYAALALPELPVLDQIVADLLHCRFELGKPVRALSLAGPAVQGMRSSRNDGHHGRRLPDRPDPRRPAAHPLLVVGNLTARSQQS